MYVQIQDAAATRPAATRPAATRPAVTDAEGPDPDHDRDRRLELLIRRLPDSMQNAVRWLRQPTARWVRIPAGLLLIVGGFLSILPLLGIWMLPLGLVLLAEDVPSIRRRTDRVLAWIEHRRPHWMGLPRQRLPLPHSPERGSQ